MLNKHVKMAQNNEDGRFGEIANQAGVVIQTQQDMKDLENRLKVVGSNDVVTYDGAAASTENSTVRVDINDLVFTVGYNNGGGMGIMNNAIPVSSNCNGLYISESRLKFPLSDPNDEEEKRQALSETIRVLGQALGGTTPMPDSPAYLKTNFTTRAQGSAHITNTGTEIINAGDMVLWDLFRKDEIIEGRGGKFTDEWKNRMARYGFSLKKVPLKLVKLSQAHTSFEYSLKNEANKRSTVVAAGVVAPKPSKTAQGRFANNVIDFLADIIYIASNPGSSNQQKVANRSDAAFKALLENAMTANEEFSDSVGHLIQGIMYMITDLERRKVGKALSFSKPGKGVDILLGAS